MDAWELSQIDAEQGARIVWTWALRRLPGAGLLCAIGIMHGYLAANDAVIEGSAAAQRLEIKPT
jgi:hypothetical protein